jgi:hypothetical protein
MILLADGVAILDEHTRLTRFETDASISAALGTAGVDHLLEDKGFLVIGTKYVNRYHRRKKTLLNS